MKTPERRWMGTRLHTVFLTLVISTTAHAVSPESLQVGRELFERQWTPGNPVLGSDGLGPLFNANSCVACHHQGGVGGGGDARFNAFSLGIERLWFTSRLGNIDNGRKSALLRQFFPGFVQADGSARNTVPLPHQGGSPEYASWRESFREACQAELSEQGGPTSAAEVRVSLFSPIVVTRTLDHVTLHVEARLFQRNTSALFGAGLIDTIPDSAIENQARIQERHPEISGRVSRLPDGTLGRFGWRANASKLVRFVDRACGNELSLETRRRPQAVDPTRPAYRNPAIDISDDQIRAMTAFLAALPQPRQHLGTDPEVIEAIGRGRAAFEAVGCAVCHVPSLGTVEGIYSDLLLHDMGPYLYDFDAAEPYVVSQKPAKQTRLVPGSLTEIPYYGNPTTVSSSFAIPDRFISPRATPSGSDYVTVVTSNEMKPVNLSAPDGNPTIRTRNAGPTLVGLLRDEIGVERKLLASNTSQEWRTPPLWGVADSAPYLHDGRASTLLQAIALHDGEAAGSRDRFLQLPLADREALIRFLESLVAPPEVPQAQL